MPCHGPRTFSCKTGDVCCSGFVDRCILSVAVIRNLIAVGRL